jgi:hypothetical protein
MNWWHWGPLAILGLGVNLWIAGYLLIGYPSECARIAILSGRAFTCGYGPGAYLFIAASLLILVAQVYTLVKWTFEGI